MKNLIIILVVLFVIPAYAADPTTLDNVLLLGDSIVLGYHSSAKAFLLNDVNVDVGAENGKTSKYLLEHLYELIPPNDYKVIVFGIGMNDIYLADGVSPQIGREQYKINLDLIARELLATGATVLFQNITFVPECRADRHSIDAQFYNKDAVQVMDALGIETINAWRMTRYFPDVLRTDPCNIHYTERGYTLIADRIAAVVLRAYLNRLANRSK